MSITTRELRQAGPRLKRRIHQDDVVCPAGTEMGGCGVFCGVEQHVVDSDNEVRSLTFCLGNYTGCTSWLSEKARIEAGRVKSLIES